LAEFRNIDAATEGGEMERFQTNWIPRLVLAGAFLTSGQALFAQQVAVLGPDDLSKIVPTNFYFGGQLAPTQVRNAAAVRFAPQRHLIAALVDTSGYASNIRSKYEGFLICDEPVMIGGTELKPGAYGFGFTDNLKMNIFDVGGKPLFSVTAVKDDQFQGPRPLSMIQSGKDLRLYRGRIYVVVTAK
jgi:hypothetical protein